jgi:transcriptional regulator of acetoin/glycerol metabolism
MNGHVDLKALAYLYDHLRDLPSWLQGLTPQQMHQLASVLARWGECQKTDKTVEPLEEVERREFSRALAAFEGDVCEVAKALGIGKTTAYRRLKTWGLDTTDWRAVSQATSLEHPVKLQYEP